MKIAIVLPSLHQSGPGIQMRNLIYPLIKLGVKIEVFYLKVETGQTLDFEGVRCQQINIWNLKKQFSKFDIIHSNGFFPDLISAIIRLKCKEIKNVTTLHNFIHEDFAKRYGVIKGNVFSLLWFCILRFVPNKIVFTEVAKQYYSDRTSGNLYVLGSGVPVADIIELKNNTDSICNEAVEKIINIKSNDFKIIGSTAVVTKVKGLDIVIRSLVILNDHVAIFVGGGKEEKSLIDLSKELGVSDRVVFLGFQKNPIYYMRFFDAYAMTSISESFGLSLFEAIACKVPVVCNKLPVFEELLNENVVHFYDGTPESFVFQIKQSYQENFSGKAYDHLMEHYDVIVVGNKYYKLYSELLSK